LAGDLRCCRCLQRQQQRLSAVALAKRCGSVWRAHRCSCPAQATLQQPCLGPLTTRTFSNAVWVGAFKRRGERLQHVGGGCWSRAFLASLELLASRPLGAAGAPASSQCTM
jgi:hypothetical protein